jgi:hypothetical protein
MGNTGVVQVGTLPAGAAVLRAYTVIGIVFNAATTNTLKIGTVASDASIVSSVVTGVLGVTLGTVTASAGFLPSVDTPIIATSTATGAVATTGSGVVVVEYCPML